MKRLQFFLPSCMVISGLIACLLPAAMAQSAKEIIEASNIDGGLAVVVGAPDPQFLSEIAEAGPFLVHALSEDEAGMDACREVLAKQGLYGKVSVDRLSGGTLPYIDNLVNLLVIRGSDPELASGEIDRVLAPRGVALVEGKQRSKPVPGAIDDWTHYLYSPDNNAVSNDMVVAPPRRLQWVAGPKYSRHHDKLSSISAVVSSGGIVFTIIDEGPLWSILVPPKWALTARDAFNGKLLWKRPIAKWHNHLFGLKSGPAPLPRRLIALGDRVYTTLGLEAPVTQLDAVTGETIREYEGTDGAIEMLLDDGVLYIVCGPAPNKEKWFEEGERTLMALRADSGEVLWSEKRWIVPGTLAILGERAFFFEKDKVTCLNCGDGKTAWQSASIPRPESFMSRYTPTLVATPEVVLISAGEASSERGWSTKGAKDTLTALDAKNGKAVWTAHHPDSGYASAEDIFVIDDMVLFGDSRDGAEPGNTYGLDLKTGKELLRFPPDRDIYFFHHRCHRGKATKQFLLTSRVGIEFIDFRKKHWEMNHWVRGACLFGIIPANGLVYAPQHPCACYLESKLDGFNALAPARSTPRFPKAIPARLESGPAMGTKAGLAAKSAADWPTYRHDNRRSGVSGEKIGENLKPAFSVEIGGRLTAPVVGSGLVITAAIDRHEVHAFDAATGKAQWSYTVGGRVDSPPTIHGQLVLFGCRDGSIYCLRASDGELVWRFRAAPVDERIVAYEQVESVWPVHGSVMVKDDVVFAAAGRTMFLDGGLRLLRLDPESGELLGETIMDAEEKIDGKDHQDYVSWLNMPVAKPDILSVRGDRVYMRSQPFEADGTRLPLQKKPWSGNPDHGTPEPYQYEHHAHVFSPTGYLDDTGWHRTYWIYGSDFYSGWCGYPTAGTATPAGKIMITDEENVYGFGRLPRFWRWTAPLEFHLFAVEQDKVGKLKLKPAGRKGKKAKGQKAQPAKPSIPDGYLWSRQYPILARAMCKAGDTVFVAGIEDVFDETAKPDQDRAIEQIAHWNGKKGGTLLGVSAKDGSEKVNLELDSPPIFDGLISARGGLYFTTLDGKLVCLKGE